jgi:hypothetical protein
MVRDLKQPTRCWKEIIEAVREEYSGKTLYCSTFVNFSDHDNAEYKHIEFWDMPDYIGINLWPSAQSPIKDVETPTVEDIKEVYWPFRGILDQWHDSNKRYKSGIGGILLV